jgi:hypothetical protein
VFGFALGDQTMTRPRAYFRRTLIKNYGSHRDNRYRDPSGLERHNPVRNEFK